MLKLRDLIKEHVKHKFSIEATDEFKEAVLDQMEQRIKKDIVLEEAKLLNRELKRKNTLDEIDKIKELFWTVVIIGIMVGVTANQVTALLPADISVIFRLGLIVVFVLVMYVFFYFKYLKEANDRITEFKEKSNV